MKIKEEIATLASEMELFDDVLDKYEYIIELGHHLQPLEARYKTDIYKVQGCQSQVWFHAFTQDKELIFEADTDSLIVKGLVSLLLRIYSHRSAQEIIDSSSKDLKALGLSEIISAGRQNGMASMLTKIYDYAQEVCDD